MTKKYLQNTSGQIAIIFALSATVLLLGIGAAIDMNGATRMKTKLQNYTDMAVIAATSSRKTDLVSLQKLVQKSFDQNNTLGSSLKPVVSIVDGVLRVELANDYDTKLLSVFNKHQVPISVLSESPISQEQSINIAMVLDRTGSMSGSNMSSLKKATVSMISQIEQSDNKSRIGLVPFSNYVNVGLQYANAPWLELPTPQKKCWMTRDIINDSLCKAVPGSYSNDGIIVNYTGKSCPDAAYGPEYETCQMQKWNGCVGSRPGKLNQKPEVKGKRVPGLLDVYCGQPLLPLTSNMNEAKTRINSLTASGNTYIPAGLIWGWRLLDANQPFNDATNKDAKRKRALIVMTDGANTLSLTQPTHDGNDTDATDSLTSSLCEEIKKDNIRIFSVAYKLTSGSSTQEAIQNCASKPGDYFQADNTAELIKAFKSIGLSMAEVRLSK